VCTRYVIAYIETHSKMANRERLCQFVVIDNKEVTGSITLLHTLRS
jgi:hypothetical protein